MDGTTGTGQYINANGIVVFTAMIVVNKETTAANRDGFGLTLPVPMKQTGARTVFQLSLDGRDADSGVWTGEALVFAGSDGKAIDRIRVTSGTNGGTMPNIQHFYGNAEGATAAEIVTISGAYIPA
ncbi:hypothetical protein AB0C52_12875 [Streptomyces sp. NPDC048717]|uniref:hypothetical protein n=1 Tax=Streptomyces sp. NPDC048717 TaxID=3154928 RepID=UPI0034483EA2